MPVLINEAFELSRVKSPKYAHHLLAHDRRQVRACPGVPTSFNVMSTRGTDRTENRKAKKRWGRMARGTNRGLPTARLLMVIGSLAPLFLLWAIRGAPPISDRYWVTVCVVLATAPNLGLLCRWRTARRSNDHRVIMVASARDQSDHLLVYLFAMLLPLYSVNLGNERELYAVVAAFAFIVFLFWHMNLHYMNIVFAALGYRVYTAEMMGRAGSVGDSVILLSKRTSPPAAGVSIDALRISDTVFVEKEQGDAERV
jgi:hypothetical protein